jgi:hypothetical protein
VALEWQPIRLVRGYFVSVIGGNGTTGPGGRGDESGEMIIWTSSELADAGFALTDYQSNANLEKWTNERVILPRTATQCTVPAGIFGTEGGAMGGGMLRMIAYGGESFFAFPPRPSDPKVAWAPEWQAKVRVKSTFSSILGGMGDLGNAGGKQDQRAPKEEKKPNPADLLRGLFGR